MKAAKEIHVFLKDINSYLSLKIKPCVLLFFFSLVINSTLESQICSGSLGDPVVNITFGAGNNPGQALSASLPNLSFTSEACPGDGFYTIVNSTAACFNDSWHTVNSDHTPNDVNGYMMLINASFNSGDFYVDTVKGLCGGTTYEFAGWVLNLLKNSACGNVGISPSLTFTIESSTGTILGTYSTANIAQSATPEWKQYGLFFKTPANGSNVVLRLTNTAPGGCGNDLALDDITFRACGPLVKLNAVGSTKFCEGDTTSLPLAATISAGYNSPVFQWQISDNNGVSWNNIPGATSSDFRRFPTAPGVLQYRVTVADEGNINIVNCRVSSNVLTITTYAKPTLNASNNGPKCPGQSISLSATGANTYNWSGPNGFAASGASVIATNNAFSGKYIVTGISAEGCSRQDSTIATTNAKPTASFSTAAPYCINSQIAFTNQSTVAAGSTLNKYSWNFGDSATASVKDPSHGFSTSNIFNVTLVVETDKGCTDTIKQGLVIHPQPEVNFGLPEVCLSDPYATFTDSSAIADNSELKFTYLWNFGDAAATPANPNNSTQRNPRHTYVSTGVYQVQETVTSKDGCINDTIKKFTVNGALPVAKFSIDTTGNGCSNKVLSITNTSTVNFGIITRVEIYWDQNNIAAKTVDESPFAGKKYDFSYPVFGNPATKDFQIKLVAYSGISCVNTTFQTVTLKASPQVQFNAIQPVCEGLDPFIITSASNTTGSAGTGVFSGPGVSADGFFNPLTAAPGQHVLRYTFVAANGCSSFADQTIIVYPQPLVNAGPDRTVLEGGFITLAASASGNNVNYLWSPPTSIENPRVLLPKVYPVNDLTYRLTVTSTDNCISTDDVFVKVLKTPVVPNVFSPNGDGINDTWTIRYLDSYPGVDVQVFDRYGQLVYHNVGYGNAWDGTRNGKPLPVGIYYYLINRKIAATPLTGSVTIIR